MEKRIHAALIACGILVSLVMTPWLNMDPNGLPRMFILVSMSFYIFGSLILNIKQIHLKFLKLYFYLTLIFVAGLAMSYLIGGNGEFAQFYGTFGRNTGLLSYFALALLYISTVTVSDRQFSIKLLWTLVIIGSLNCIYSLIQYFELDPIEWNNPYNRILGTFGNPNFVSAFLGMASSVTIVIVLDNRYSRKVRSILTFQLILSLFLIVQSSSIQGILVFLLTTAVFIYFRFIQTFPSKVLKFGFWNFILTSVILGGLGVLNRGPMATLLFQDSVTYRGDYWRAGWNMTISKPFFGFGMDSYGDWYRLYRTKEATLRRGPDAVSNSAHNVLLDLSSSGGFFLLFGYLLILFFTLRSAINILKQKPKFDAIGSSLVLAWFAYLIQSLISINQLGLAFWGWVLSGAIVGYDLRMRNPQLGVENKSKSPVPAGTILMGISGLAIGITISIWPLVKDISFRSALETRNATIMDKSASRFPQTSYYYVYLSELYLTNKLNDRSLEMANKALEINSRDFNALKILLANSTISEYEERSIRDRMLEIDPFNYTIKASK